MFSNSANYSSPLGRRPGASLISHPLFTSLWSPLLVSMAFHDAG